MSNKRIVEIGGVKLEVDMREARTVESYKIGDRVKVLVKGYSSYNSHAGIIAGFDNFKSLPTVIVAYLENEYSAEIKFVYLNSESTDIEICPMSGDSIAYSKETAIEALDKTILSKEREVDELKLKKDFFLTNFGKYFNETKELPAC